MPKPFLQVLLISACLFPISPGTIYLPQIAFSYTIYRVLARLYIRPVFPGSRTKVIRYHAGTAIFNQVNKRHIINLSTNNHYSDRFTRQNTGSRLNLVNNAAQQLTRLLYWNTHCRY
ncbi:hypothetical protein ES703_117804 [subsurface metagenome]